MSGLADHLEGWAPGPAEWTDRVTGWSVGAFADLLDQPDPLAAGDPVVPPMWHWLGFLPHPAQSALGADGHPAAGHFLPPLPHRRRMFAGARWTERRPLPVDTPVGCRSEITSTRVTSGRSGEMAFVTVRTAFTVAGVEAATEEQDIVYRSQPDPEPGTAAPARAAAPDTPERPEGPPPGEHRVTLTPDETLLFRFSALTYNAHRIHYDHPYATGVEGYPGLVVHGPLLALLALEVPRRHAAARVTEFAYRLTRPAFAHRPLLAWSEPADAAGRVALACSAGAAEPSLTGTAGPGATGGS
ncbi:MAG TPA: MaoC family dehydratase N-terminal domain-containing protein [Pseudonocardia sp.]|jgi:3-methylfumaryl-CoA hydratase